MENENEEEEHDEKAFSFPSFFAPRLFETKKVKKSAKLVPLKEEWRPALDEWKKELAQIAYFKNCLKHSEKKAKSLSRFFWAIVEKDLGEYGEMELKDNEIKIYES